MSELSEFYQIEDYFADIRVCKETGCHLWEGSRSPNGYGIVNFYGRTQSAHRNAWEEMHGEIEDGKIILHSCDVKLCVNPEHMSLGSKADNTADMIKKGRQNWSTPGRKRVTTVERDAMVSLHQQGQSWYRIAKTLGRTSQQHVKQVVETYLGIGTAVTA